MRYAKGCGVEHDNFIVHTTSRKMLLSLSATYILRHIFYSHNLPLPTVLSLWSCFYVLVMRRPLDVDQFIGQSALWNNVQRLHYIDQALATSAFKPFISQRTKHGFRRYFYSSSDDSEHFKRNRHVLIMSSNTSTDFDNPQPSYRHVTSSVNAIKSKNAHKNATAIIEMLGVEHALYYGGGTNDNAGDAQKEIKETFKHIMAEVEDCDQLTPQQLHNLLYENGVMRRPISFGDPYHIANLCVT